MYNIERIVILCNQGKLIAVNLTMDCACIEYIRNSRRHKKKSRVAVQFCQPSAWELSFDREEYLSSVQCRFMEEIDYLSIGHI